MFGFQEQAGSFQPSPELKAVINDGIDRSRPILLTGADAVQAAYYAAHKLETRLFHFRVSRDSQILDLLYSFDRDAFQFDVQLAQVRANEPRMDKNNYVVPRALWQAIETGLESGLPAVLLVDGLDRASPDFIEDLLLELDLLQFTVKETGNIIQCDPQVAPITFLTAARRSKLPSNLLRHCVSHNTGTGDDGAKPVFLSYAREDAKMARRVYDDLNEEGIPVWFDEEDLLPGQDWNVEIRKVIKSCSLFVPLLSTKSVSKKGYVQKELKLALDLLQELPTNSIFVVPVRLDDCEPIDEPLQALHWADIFPDYAKGLSRLVRVLLAKL